MSTEHKSNRQRYYIRTFGCQMNVYDSGRMSAMLEAHGYRRARSYSDASVIILNTCTVRKKAEDKVYSELGRLRKIKALRPELIVCVGGCLAQQEAGTLIKRFSFIDVVFGTQALPRIPDLLLRALQGKKSVYTNMDPETPVYPADTYSPDPGRVSAFVTIMQGCNNFCSYCIVPYVRGPEWSREPGEIIREVSQLVRCGIQEVTLLGQNVNSYGHRLVSKTSFPELLSSLNTVEGLQRIRFTTSHPKDLSDDLIQSFAHLEKLCAHIHLPLQSGSDTILSSMNRKYTSTAYKKRIDLLRGTVPGISITSDIIVGFPGETESEFQKTVSMVQSVEFDDIFIFHYTDRPKTRASTFPEKVPYKTRVERLETLKDIQEKISLEKNRLLVGAEESVLFESVSKKDNSEIAGRTSTNKVVNCSGQSELIGCTAAVRITQANIHSLKGMIIPGRTGA